MTDAPPAAAGPSTLIPAAAGNADARTAVDDDPWQRLRAFTAARIGLGRAGDALPTRAALDFALAHACARDAVHAAFDAAAVVQSLERMGRPSLHVRSAADNRAIYLRRPDLGRRLIAADAERLAAAAGPEVRAGTQVDLVLMIGDGLSAPAVMRHAPALVQALLPLLPGWHIGPIVVADQARVALGDEVGGLLRARAVAVLIGERPGLSSPDSLGVYLTWQPSIGRTDAERNCISNVRPEGLPIALAAQRLAWLLHESRRRRLSGVQLKDDSGIAALPDAP